MTPLVFYIILVVSNNDYEGYIMRKCDFNDGEYILVNEKDVHEFFSMQNRLVERFIYNFLHIQNTYTCISQIPYDSKDFDFSYIKTGVRWSNIKNTQNPLLGLSQSIKQLQESIIDCVLKGEVLINISGGYCPVDERQEITNIRNFDYCEQNCLIRENTKYLNLENDSKLESDAIGFLKTVDDNYSYLLNLRNYSNKTLENIISRFYENGGKYIYVYTTGSDIEQMESYINCAINAHIKNEKTRFSDKPLFIFEFSGTVDKELSDFMYDLEIKGDIGITIIGGCI